MEATTAATGAANRWRRIALASAVGVLLAATASEIALRVFFIEDGLFRGTRPLPPFEAITNPRQRAWLDAWLERIARNDTTETGLGEFRMDIGWTMRPNASDGTYRTNALGARGPRNYADAPDDDVFRLLCYGDSFTFCDEVKHEQSWPARLESRTANVEAINFGVGAYGTDQALIRYRQTRSSVVGHGVAIGIMLDDIGRNVNRYRPLYYPSTPVAYAKPRFRLAADGTLAEVPLPYTTFADYLRAIDDGSVIATLAKDEYWSSPHPIGASLATVRLAAGYFAYRNRSHRSAWEDTAGEPFRVTLAILERFHREAIANGALIAPVLIFPAESDMIATLSEGRRYWQTLTDALQARGVPFIDLAEDLERECRSRNLSGGELYGGGHLNARGNEIVADKVLDWLEATLAASEPRRPRRH